jgi:hypothetical protein
LILLVIVHDLHLLQSQSAIQSVAATPRSNADLACTQGLEIHSRELNPE